MACAKLKGVLNILGKMLKILMAVWRVETQKVFKYLWTKALYLRKKKANWNLK